MTTLTTAPTAYKPIISDLPFNGSSQKQFEDSERRRLGLSAQVAEHIAHIEAGGSRDALADWLQNAGLLRCSKREEFFAGRPTVLVLHSRALTLVNAHIAIGQGALREQMHAAYAEATAP